MKYTIVEFRKQFPNDDACLDKLFQLRYGKLECCPKCEKKTRFHRCKSLSKIRKAQRKCYECQYCGYQLYPTAGTVFEKTTTPLTLWFQAIYLFTSTRNGVAAKELQRQLGVTYKTAWKMAHQIRLLMANRKAPILSGTVELDETYIGGLNKNKHKKVRKALQEQGTGTVNKIPVFGMLQRDGSIITEVLNVNKVTGEILKPIIREMVDPNAILITDGHGAYYGLKKEFLQHEIIHHDQDEYVRDSYHTNTIEGFWSQLKRTIKGTHIHVSHKHLQKYVDECAFRYMLRKSPNSMFEVILSHVSSEVAA